jgi:hypothetical protein
MQNHKVRKNESKTTIALQRRSEHASGILFSFLFLFGDEEIPTEQPPHAGGVSLEPQTAKRIRSDDVCAVHPPNQDLNTRAFTTTAAGY